MDKILHWCNDHSLKQICANITIKDSSTCVLFSTNIMGLCWTRKSISYLRACCRFGTKNLPKVWLLLQSKWIFGDIRESVGKQNQALFNLEIFKESVLTGMLRKYQRISNMLMPTKEHWMRSAFHTILLTCWVLPFKKYFKDVLELPWMSPFIKWNRLEAWKIALGNLIIWKGNWWHWNICDKYEKGCKWYLTRETRKSRQW